ERRFAVEPVVALEHLAARAAHDRSGAGTQPVEPRPCRARTRSQLPDAARQDPAAQDRTPPDLPLVRSATRPIGGRARPTRQVATSRSTLVSKLVPRWLLMEPSFRDRVSSLLITSALLHSDLARRGRTSIRA